MTKWVVRMIQNNTGDALSKSKDDFAEIAHQAGYQYLDIQRYDRTGESYDALGSRIEGITGGVKAGDLLVYQYPTYNGNQFEVSFAEHTVYRGIQLVLLIHDYERLRFGAYSGYDEIRELNLATALIVPTKEMRAQMRSDGVTSPIVLQESWDFLTDQPFHEERLSREVVIAGAFAKSDILSTWSQDIPLIAYGRNDEGQDPAVNVDYRGILSHRELVKVLPNCFGLAWDTGENFGEYTKYNAPHKVAMYLALGMPVIVWKQSAIAKLIDDNHLGFTINSLDEIPILLKSLSDQELDELQERVKKFGMLLRRGYFTRRLLVDLEQQLTDSEFELELHPEDENSFAMVKVLDISETIGLIKDTHPSVIRLGEGEVHLIKGMDIDFQHYQKQLAQQLDKILQKQSNDKLLICLPDIFGSLAKYTKVAIAFWGPHRIVNSDVYEKLPKDNVYGSAFISRPYMDLIDKSYSKKYFAELKDLWFQRDILIVEGKDTRSGVGNDLFADARSVERIIAPATDAFDKLSEIEHEIKKHGRNKLTLLMLGPTAKIVVDDLYEETGLWLIDLGHVDSEYEWFKMGAKTKVRLKNKHTAELYDLTQMDIIEDPIYESQIVTDLSD